MGYRIRFGLPGPAADWATLEGFLSCSTKHEVMRPQGIGHGGVGNFDDLWCEAHNAYEAGEADLYVKLHSDVHPMDSGWLDVMVDVMERRRVSLVSCVIAMKDNRMLVSSGVSEDPDNPWIGRMVKIKDLASMPLDFDQSDLGYPDRPLLHNNGCILFDLRDDRWRATDANGNMKFCWNFPRRNRKTPEGFWVAEGNSEDWQFSRMAHEMGIKSVITRRIRLGHRGTVIFPNWDARKEIAAQRLPEDAEVA